MQCASLQSWSLIQKAMYNMIRLPTSRNKNNSINMFNHSFLFLFDQVIYQRWKSQSQSSLHSQRQAIWNLKHLQAFFVDKTLWHESRATVRTSKCFWGYVEPLNLWKINGHFCVWEYFGNYFFLFWDFFLWWIKIKLVGGFNPFEKY